MTADPQQLFQQGLEFHQGGRIDEALLCYRQVVEVAPDFFEAHGLMGLLLDLQGQYHQAEESYRKALNLRPDVPEIILALGNVLRVQKKLSEAETTIQKSLNLDPENVEAHCALGFVLKALDRPDEAAVHFTRALEIDPQNAQAHNCLGVELIDQGDIATAETAFRKAIDCDSSLVSAHVNLAEAMSKSGRHADARACYQKAMSLAPDDADIYGDYFLGLMREGDQEAALSMCDTILEKFPGNVDALAFKGAVLHELGRTSEATVLFDFDRFLRSHLIEVPDSYADLSALNGALGEHVLNHPTLVQSSRQNATRFGGHTGDLLSEPKGPMADFEIFINKAVKDYINQLPGEAAHPFLASVPSQWSLTVWAVVIGDKGHQISHIHPSAWLSGVYYASVPDDICADDDTFAGWIEFGRPDDEIKITREPLVERIQPKSGLCAFFPSYFYHNTVPYTGSGTRISIAFDVVKN
jgi:Flp pilus assembly protein TadD